MSQERGTYSIEAIDPGNWRDSIQPRIFRLLDELRQAVHGGTQPHRSPNPQKYNLVKRCAEAVVKILHDAVEEHKVSTTLGSRSVLRQVG
jgi:hypothetical protein